MSRELHIVGFKVGRETYGVPITSLHEIVRVPEITAVPDAPDYLEGVINLRGKIVSVMDLRKRFGEKQAAEEAEPHSGGRARGQAGRADRGFGFGSIEDSCRRRGSSARRISGWRTELCDRTRQGRGRLVVLLDMSKLLAPGSLQIKSEPEKRSRQPKRKAPRRGSRSSRRKLEDHEERIRLTGVANS